MKTENEIKALPLEEKQKLVIELRAVKPSEKTYPNAKAIIELITAGKDWKEPKTVEVANVSGHEIVVDGATIAPEATGKVYAWQLTALARFLSPVAKAAALLLLSLGLSAATAQAQTQTYAVGSPGQYNVVYVAGLSGGTNVITGTNATYGTGTNATYGTGTITTNSLITPSVLVSNGVTYFSTVTNLSYTTDVPGLVSVVNHDLLDVFWGFQLTGAGTGTATFSMATSPDGVFWQTNAIAGTLAAAGTAFVSTNITLSVFAPGYVRLDVIGYPSAAVTQTNVVVAIGRKSARTGP